MDKHPPKKLLTNNSSFSSSNNSVFFSLKMGLKNVLANDEFPPKNSMNKSTSTVWLTLGSVWFMIRSSICSLWILWAGGSCFFWVPTSQPKKQQSAVFLSILTKYHQLLDNSPPPTNPAVEEMATSLPFGDLISAVADDNGTVPSAPPPLTLLREDRSEVVQLDQAFLESLGWVDLDGNFVDWNVQVKK